jgi:hypothetical protein
VTTDLLARRLLSILQRHARHLAPTAPLTVNREQGSRAVQERDVADLRSFTFDTHSVVFSIMPRAQASIIPASLIPVLYRCAGLSNFIGVGAATYLLHSSDSTVPSSLRTLGPALFTPFGLSVIALWGLAYIAVSSHWLHLRSIALVFALEKLLYVVEAGSSLSQHRAAQTALADVWHKAPLPAALLGGAGLGDAAAMFLFLYAAWKAWEVKAHRQ